MAPAAKPANGGEGGEVSDVGGEEEEEDEEEDEEEEEEDDADTLSDASGSEEEEEAGAGAGSASKKPRLALDGAGAGAGAGAGTGAGPLRRPKEVHTGQWDVAQRIVHFWRSEGGSIALLVAKVQSGKTGVLYATAHIACAQMGKEDANVFVLTGMSDRDWKVQTERRMNGRFKVLHNPDLRRLGERLRLTTNSLLIVDECHIASGKRHALRAALHKGGLLDIEALKASGHHILFVSATPDRVLFDLETWDVQFRLVRMEAGPGYVGLEHADAAGRLRPAPKKLTAAFLDEYMAAMVARSPEPKYHLVRARQPAAHALVLARATLKGFATLEYDSAPANKEMDLCDTLQYAPTRHTVVLVKGKLMAAKTLWSDNSERKAQLRERGLRADRFCGSTLEVQPQGLVNVSASTQGLPGRFCGYEPNTTPGAEGVLHYTDVGAIRTYLQWWKADCAYVNYKGTAGFEVREGLAAGRAPPSLATPSDWGVAHTPHTRVTDPDADNPALHLMGSPECGTWRFFVPAPPGVGALPPLEGVATRASEQDRATALKLGWEGVRKEAAALVLAHPQAGKLPGLRKAVEAMAKGAHPFKHAPSGGEPRWKDAWRGGTRVLAYAEVWGGRYQTNQKRVCYRGGVLGVAFLLVERRAAGAPAAEEDAAYVDPAEAMAAEAVAAEAVAAEGGALDADAKDPAAMRPARLFSNVPESILTALMQQDDAKMNQTARKHAKVQVILEYLRQAGDVEKQFAEALAKMEKVETVHVVTTHLDASTGLPTHAYSRMLGFVRQANEGKPTTGPTRPKGRAGKDLAYIVVDRFVRRIVVFRYYGASGELGAV